MKILIVEDDPVLRQQLAQQLEQLGFQSQQAADGMKAISMPVSIRLIWR